MVMDLNWVVVLQRCRFFSSFTWDDGRHFFKRVETTVTNQHPILRMRPVEHPPKTSSSPRPLPHHPSRRQGPDDFESLNKELEEAAEPDGCARARGRKTGRWVDVFLFFGLGAAQKG